VCHLRRHLSNVHKVELSILQTLVKTQVDKFKSQQNVEIQQEEEEEEVREEEEEKVSET